MAKLMTLDDTRKTSKIDHPPSKAAGRPEDTRSVQRQIGGLPGRAQLEQSIENEKVSATYGEAPQQHEAANTGQAEAKPAKVVGSTRALGQALFSKDNGFILPFEIVSILLLVAMVGVILLSRKEPR